MLLCHTMQRNRNPVPGGTKIVVGTLRRPQRLLREFPTTQIKVYTINISLRNRGGKCKVYSKICNIASLYSAHKNARVSKRKKKDVIKFELDLPLQLWTLKKKLDTGQYCGSGYHEFKIYEPKERLIQAAAYGDRVVQHSICDNIIAPYVARHVVYDNGACQIGKGTHFAMNRLVAHMRKYYHENGPNGYVLKADIKKYFPSIDHEVLKNQWARSKLDEETKNLLFRIIDSYATPMDSPDIPRDGRPRGLPMGNQTSQQFAVFYLDRMDREIKEKWGIKYYTRYMDDIIVIHQNKEYLVCLLEAMKEIATELKLEFNQKTQIIPLKNGIDYVGWHFSYGDRGKIIKKIRTGSKKRILKKIKALSKQYAKGVKDFQAVNQTVQSYLGHLKHGNTYGLRRKIFKNFILEKEGN